MKQPTIALIYDFDGTLSPGNMQEFGFINQTNHTTEEFWDETNKIAKDQDASEILTYMYYMLKAAKANNISLKRQSFQEFGSQITFFNGVEEWFGRINKFAQQQGVILKHYIISSGLKEMIEGTRIAQEFEQIYACSFLYNVDGIAEWPAASIDYTAKTQILFKINKGIKEVNDNTKINRYMDNDKRPVPFENMIYFGDGETDVPSMKMVKDHGGHAIAVHDPNSKEREETVKNLLLEERVNFVTEADYTPEKPLNKLVEYLIKKIKIDTTLKEFARQQKRDITE